MAGFYFLILLSACAAAAATGSVFLPGEWYRSLKKPSWTPPKKAFPIVWTALYVISAFAATRIALSANPAPGLALWSLQIALNTLWTPVFFGARRMGMGMIVIAVLWVVLAAIIPVFLQADLLAGLLMIPYLVWISIAAGLNWRIWRDNRDLA
ncbi:tryptophan-rich sensory protein TspO [Paracoccus aerodenitrificans]|uniref:tryptophan-rich sensory protein TspO n=1 Tax=Paracoccus aerodenitrificans TaxID=3017781 RepID=UPI0022F0C9B1|nr:TspO/MBR family protein [Paracoccus aerodenitrificans]WBU63748.1 tryptophan-rich sensory protein [Paracoccus aerodenitrificans]